MLDQVVLGQVSLRSFCDLFRYVGIAFLLTLPLLILLGRGGSKSSAAGAH
jgi:DHA2 family multidrug resistance protein